MATLIKVLSPSEIIAFDHPPEMNFEQRRTNFYLTASLKKKLSSLHKPVTRVGLVLQYGYYKCSRKFFKLKTFHIKDIKFICDLLEVDESIIDIRDYKFVLKEHKSVVLKLFGKSSILIL